MFPGIIIAAKSQPSKNDPIAMTFLYLVGRITRAYSDLYGSFPSIEPRRVVVTGLGLITPLGFDVQSTWERIIKGHTGVKRLLKTHLPEVSSQALFPSFSFRI